MRITGIFTKLLEVESGTSKKGQEWKKQSFIVDTGSQFNPEVCITAFGKDIELIQDIKEGTKVECQVNVSSREYNGKWYHNINIWQIDKQEDKKEDVKNEDQQEYPF